MVCAYCQLGTPEHPFPVHLHSQKQEGLLITRFWSDGARTYLNAWNGKEIEGACF